VGALFGSVVAGGNLWCSTIIALEENPGMGIVMAVGTTPIKTAVFGAMWPIVLPWTVHAISIKNEGRLGGIFVPGLMLCEQDYRASEFRRMFPVFAKPLSRMRHINSNKENHSPAQPPPNQIQIQTSTVNQATPTQSTRSHRRTLH
jgi:hypothetical protein